MEIRLLAASVDQPLPVEGGQKSTSLVPIHHLPPVRTSSAGTDTTYFPEDDYVWSVTTADDGSFHFSATPRKTVYAESSYSQSGQPEEMAGEYLFDTPWTQTKTRNAAAQYQFYATLSAAPYQPTLSVYA